MAIGLFGSNNEGLQFAHFETVLVQVISLVAIELNDVVVDL